VPARGEKVESLKELGELECMKELGGWNASGTRELECIEGTEQSVENWKIKKEKIRERSEDRSVARTAAQRSPSEAR
jgi:hypothetical protein